MISSPGKLWGMRRMADASGRFRMTAVDQRPPIINPIAKHHGGVAPWEEVARFKRLLVEKLQGESTAMLLDPIWAIPYGIDALDPSKGLIVTLEAHDFAETEGGRLSHEIPDWSVGKIRRMGGDAVKVLAWYRPDASEAVRIHQQDFAKRIGEACARYDIPYLFELLVYPLPGDAHQTRDYVEMGGKKAEHVLASVEEFAKPEYGVDVFKLESPIGAGEVPGVDTEGWEEVQKLFDEMGRLAGRPWVMLSAGASKAQFRNILTHAYKAGASGYLAGRAIWQDAFTAYPEWNEIAIGLEGDSVDYMNQINALTEARAMPWFEHPVFGPAGPRLSPADASFPSSYGEA